MREESSLTQLSLHVRYTAALPGGLDVRMVTSVLLPWVVSLAFQRLLGEAALEQRSGCRVACTSPLYSKP